MNANSQKHQITIHASNVNGLGASKVATSFLNAYVNIYSEGEIILPSNGLMTEFLRDYKGGVQIRRFKRSLPNNVSRFLESFFSYLYFDKHKRYVILGDIPLRGIRNQVVLVHQPNLISVAVNANSGKGFKYSVNRWLFKINSRYVKKFVVQTQVMKEELERSYPMIKERIVVMPQPIPSELIVRREESFLDGKEDEFLVKRTFKELTLFYPAAFYPHKNHTFFSKIKTYVDKMDVKLKVYFTLEDCDFQKYRELDYIVNLGRLDSNSLVKIYNEVDALVFVSKAESYGLPLIEAMYFGLPVISIDLPYARWVLEDTGFFFKEDSEPDFIDKILQVRNCLNKDYTPDYSKPLAKFPKDWNNVVSRFITFLSSE